MYSLFDYAFAPTRIVVVSEERLKQAEKDAMEQRIEAIDHRIDELSSYRETLKKELTALDTPQSLEEALTGE
jgi:DNA-binding protein H-NS